MERTPAGPWALVESLRAYLASTSWCAWLEVAGSLGRGAGDEASDVDAGAGVSPDTAVPVASVSALDAALRFAPVAGHLTTPFGSAGGVHHAIQYRDGRQLSLAVMPGSARPGLPRGALAVLDRSGRLAQDFAPAVLAADAAAVREWAFLAWWELGDADKHLRRGALWRAMTSLEESRRQAWRLQAWAGGVDYPLFGAVSLEISIADGIGSVPEWMAGSYPTRVDADAIRRAVETLGRGLDDLTAALDEPAVIGLRTVIRDRLRG